MANALIERMHPGYDGSRVAVEDVWATIILIIETGMTNAQAISAIEVRAGNLTQDEKDEFEALVGLMPSALSGLTGLLAPIATLSKSPQHDWASKVRAITLGLDSAFPGLDEPAEVRTALGLPDPDA